MTQPTDTSIASQDYLEQIFQLIALKGYARSVDIAANLGVSQASVSAMLKRLGTDGLVVYEKYRGVILTEKGSDLAQYIIKRHEVLTRLLRHFGVEEEMARIARGRMMEPEDLPKLMQEIRALPEPRPLEMRLALWQHPLVISVLVLLATLFWIGRKWNGQI